MFVLLMSFENNYTLGIRDEPTVDTLKRWF